MPADSTQRLACHIASSASAPQLNASNVIFEVKQFDFAAVALNACPNHIDRSLNRLHILFAGCHISPSF
jgi:hypothetical protein